MIMLCATLWPAMAAAQSCTPIQWAGAQEDWSNGPSWSAGSEPTVDNCVTIASGGIVNVTLAGETCAELTLGASDATGGVMQLWFGSSLDVAGPMLVGAGGISTVTQFHGSCVTESLELGTGSYIFGNGTFTTGSMIVGTASITASFTVSGGAATVTGDMELQSPGGLVVVGSGTLDVGGNLIIGGRFSVTGDLSPGIEVAALSMAPGGTIAPFVTQTGYDPIVVTGTAQLGETLSVTDFEAANGTYNVIEAGDLVGNFTTVQLPDDDWSWGIDGNTVWIRKAATTPVQEATWGNVKALYH
jgi:hypothetical protein